MSNTEKKTLIRAFFDAFGNNVPEALSGLDEAVIWRAMGREGDLPMSGEMDRDGIAQLMGAVANTFVDGLKFTYHAWTIEDDRVALEMESHGEKQDGTVYNNHYHFLITVADDRITALREYGDTYHVWRVFIDG